MSRCRLASLAVIPLLAGCVRLSQPAPVLRDYRLDYPPPTVAGTSLPVIVQVLRLRVAAVYDRQLIVYRINPYSTGTYPYDRWGAGPGNMIADLLARDLAASGLYRAVQQGPALLGSDYQLTGELEEIEERPLNPACAAHLQMRMQLLRVATRRQDPVLLDNSYTADEPCPCNDPGALAAAMSNALARISAQMQDAVYDRIRASTVAGAHTRAGSAP